MVNTWNQVKSDVTSVIEASSNLPITRKHHMVCWRSLLMQSLMALEPGKERWYICNRGFFQLAHHKRTSNGLLKKPVDAVTNGKHLEPGNERCDICNRGFFHLAHHKKTSHGLLKKSIDAVTNGNHLEPGKERCEYEFK